MEIENTNDKDFLIKAYMKTLPLPAKHFFIYALVEGLIWGPFTTLEIATKFNLSPEEVEKIYKEALTMLNTLNAGINSHGRKTNN